MARIQYGVISDRGDKREENQDSILCLDGLAGKRQAALFLVADGMGGLSHGSQISQYIIHQFQLWWESDFLQITKDKRVKEEDIREILEQEIWEINQSVLQFREKMRCRAGSTISLLLLYGSKYYLLNLGDSRIYIFQKGKIFLLTRDQTLAAQMVREKRMTEEEAKHSSKNSVLTMCIGMFPIPRSYFLSGTIKRDALFLLCSDGLYHHLEDRQIQEVLRDKQLDVQQKAEVLRRLIRPGTASDNVSVIVVSVNQRERFLVRRGGWLE